MAKMIPTDSYFDERSGEKNMYEALKGLTDDYYVFHSYRLVQLIPGKGLNENEIDFLIFNPNYGCLFLECKNSKLKREEDGQWKYVKNENGIIKEIPMKDPFNQAFTGQHNLFNKFRDVYPDYLNIINNCKFMVSVWFPKYTRDELEEINLGPNIIKDIILTKDELKNSQTLQASIKFLMERMNTVHLVCKYEEEKIIDNAPGYSHNLSHSDSMLFLNKILCPTFKSIINVKKEYEETYIQLLEEQYIVLDFLVHQRTAAISGSSGTGKTLVAIERARRLSDDNQKVLFLCYNRNLKEWLSSNYSKTLNNVDFYTLDSFCCKLCSCSINKINYHDLRTKIENDILDNSFEYKHIIIDEGQDFGRNGIDESEILELLSNYGKGEFDNDDTSFFIFYDQNQLVNSDKIPSYLQNVDSKLTLYKNCRNTKNIANTAYSLIEKKPILFDNAWNGDRTSFIKYRNEDFIKKLNNLIDKYSGEEKIIITCCESIKNSSLYSELILDSTNNYYYKYKNKRIKVFTAAKFKGLECDNVIMIDITNETFDVTNKTFYVGASRAKKSLYVLVNDDLMDYSNIIETRFKDSFPQKDKFKQLVLIMKGQII